MTHPLAHTLAGVEYTAHTAQRWIDKAYDARITVVGGRQFGAAIDARTPCGRVDFRADYDALSYEVVEPPPQVSQGIQDFMGHVGLVFGDSALAASAPFPRLPERPGAIGIN